MKEQHKRNGNPKYRGINWNQYETSHRNRVFEIVDVPLFNFDFVVLSHFNTLGNCQSKIVV